MHAPGGSWVRASTRCALYERAGWRCAYCGHDVPYHGVELTLDHLLGERANLGYNRPDNLVAACWDCNVLGRHRSSLHRWLAQISVHGLPHLPGSEVDIRQVLLRVHHQVDAPLSAALRARGRLLHSDPPDWLRQMNERLKGRFIEGVRRSRSGVEPLPVDPLPAPDSVARQVGRLPASHPDAWRQDPVTHDDWAPPELPDVDPDDVPF